VHGSPLPETEAGHGREVSPLALREDSTRVERRVHLHLVLHIIETETEREREKEKESEISAKMKHLSSTSVVGRASVKLNHHRH